MKNALLIGNVFSVVVPLVLFLIFRYFEPFDWSILKAQLKQYSFWIIIFFLLLMFVHELLHAFFFPKRGLSSDTLVITVPKKLIVVAFYKGELSKVNFLISLIAPFIFLTIMPLIYCLYDFYPMVFVLALVNSSFSGLDIFSAWIVYRNSPQNSILRNSGYYSYFRLK